MEYSWEEEEAEGVLLLVFRLDLCVFQLCEIHTADSVAADPRTKGNTHEADTDDDRLLMVKYV